MPHVFAWSSFVDSAIFPKYLMVAFRAFPTTEAVGSSFSDEDISIGLLELYYSGMQLIESVLECFKI